MLAFTILQPEPQHILLIGLGGGSLVKHCYHHFPASRITVIELDDYTIAQRDRFMLPPDDECLQIIHGDGVRYLADHALQVDVLLVDSIQPDMLQPAELRLFYAGCKRALSRAGVMMTNLYSKNIADVKTPLDKLYASFGCRKRLCSFMGGSNNLVALAVKNEQHWIVRRDALTRFLHLLEGFGMAPDFFSLHNNQVRALHALNKQWLRHSRNLPAFQHIDASDRMVVLLETPHPPACPDRPAGVKVEPGGLAA